MFICELDDNSFGRSICFLPDQNNQNLWQNTYLLKKRTIHIYVKDIKFLEVQSLKNWG